MTDQYFITWNKQVGTPQMTVSGARHDEFLLSDGRPVYDFTSTSFQTSFGHSCDAIRRRIHEQLDEMPVASPKSRFPLKQHVSKRLLQLLNLGHGDRAGKLFYTVSGSESVENALKIARHSSGRSVVLARHRSYHGATLGAMSVSGDWRSSGHLNFSEGTVRIPEPPDDPQAAELANIVRQTGPQRIAALIVETISGVNGVVIPPQSWWDGVVRVCRQNGIFLICDEVLAGFGRTGKPFAFQHFGLEPDFVCMSKGITGGYIPFGAVWVSPGIADRYDDVVLACGLTSYGHPLGLAALDGVLDLLDDPAFLKSKQELEQIFSRCLARMEQLPGISGTRHRGLLAAIDFHERAPDWESCLEAGLYLVAREKMLILAPPFVSEPRRLERAFETLTALIAGHPVVSAAE